MYFVKHVLKNKTNYYYYYVYYYFSIIIIIIIIIIIMCINMVISISIIIISSNSSNINYNDAGQWTYMESYQLPNILLNIQLDIYYILWWLLYDL